MKRKLIFLYSMFLLATIPAYAQIFSLTDTTTVFKNQDGKILNKEEVQELMKTSFSMTKENADGKQIITIIPASDKELAERNAALEAFKKNLIGKPLTPFKIPGLDYKVWESDQLRGRVLVMNFWFTTCSPCIREMPVLNELAAGYSVKNVIFLAPAPEKAFQIRKFLKKNKFSYNIIPGAGDYIHAMQIQNFPTHFIIDKNGIIRQVFIGFADDIKEKLKTEIDKLLKERW